MGAIASQIANSSFNFQDGGASPSKHRLITSYNNYVAQAKQAEKEGIKINVFNFISDLVTDDDKPIGSAISEFGKKWPAVEGELLS